MSEVKRDVFRQLRKLTVDANDELDTIQNLSEQLHSATKLNCSNLQITKACPDWQSRLQGRLALELSDSLDSFARIVDEFAAHIQPFFKLAETDSTIVSDTQVADFVILLTHLQAVHAEWKNFLVTALDNIESTTDAPKLVVKKKQLFDQNIEIRRAYERLRSDWALLGD